MSTQPAQTPPRSFTMVASHVVEKIPIKTALELVTELGLSPPTLIDPSGTDVMVQIPDEPSAWVSLYDFGSVAFFNVSAAQQARVLAAVRSRCTALSDEPTSDDFRVIIEPHAAERVSFDHAVLNEPSRAKIGIIALLVAQSATLEHYERQVETLLDSAETISEPMKRHGKLPRYDRDTIRFIGISLSTRRDLVSRLYILDEPEGTWEDAALDRLFKQMKATLDIEVRYRALEYKLGLIQEGVDVIVELTNAQRNIWLEIIIVLLIVVEIALALGVHK